MKCVPVRMGDGTKVLVTIAPGTKKLTERDKGTIAEYVQFCRDRAAERQRQRNREVSK